MTLPVVPSLPNGSPLFLREHESDHLAWFEKRAFIDSSRDIDPKDAEAQLEAATRLSKTINLSELPVDNKFHDPEIAKAIEEVLVAIRARIDHDKLIVLPALGPYFILFGQIFVLLGILGFTVAATGVSIPFVDVILKNMPLSIAFSMTVIRTGLHLIYQGTRLGRYPNRDRQETQLYYRLLSIMNNISRLTPQQLKGHIREMRRLDARLQSDKQLRYLRDRDYLFGKDSHDLPSFLQQNYLYLSKMRDGLSASRQQVGLYSNVGYKIHDLLTALPRLDRPNLPGVAPDTPPDQIDLSKDPPYSPQTGCLEGMRQFWERNLRALGLVDMALGAVMLVTAISGLLFLCFPEMASEPFAIIAKDPSLSVSFALLLGSGSINCFKMGWTMLKYIKREKKRTDIEVDMQLIDLGIERKKKHDMRSCFTWVMNYLERCKNDPHITSEDRAILDRVKDSVLENHRLLMSDERYLKSKEEGDRYLLALAKGRATVKSPQDTSQGEATNRIWNWFTKDVTHRMADSAYWLGKKILPHLATPSSILGLIITIFGVGCLAMSITDTIPERLEWLVEHTPLSELFSCGLIISGIFAIYRGATIAQRLKKKKMKDESITLRKRAISKLYDLPIMEPPATAFATTVPHHPRACREIDLNRAERNLSEREKLIRGMSDSVTYNSDAWNAFWIRSLPTLKFVIGASALFVLISSIIGLLISFKIVSPSDNLSFISDDPSFSASFCITLLIIAFDAFNGTWRIGTWGRRRQEDQNALNILRLLDRKLFVASRPPPTRAPIEMRSSAPATLPPPFGTFGRDFPIRV